MSEQDEERALKDLSEVVERYARIVGLEGVCTEWVLIVGSQGFEDGQSFSQVGTFVPDGIPYYRTIGLMDYALTRARLKISGQGVGDADD